MKAKKQQPDELEKLFATKPRKSLIAKAFEINGAASHIATAEISKANAEAKERAFGHMEKKEHKSEWYVQKEVAKYMKQNYPHLRFYSSLDGFDLGNQRSLIGSLQWFEAGFPDMLILVPSKEHTMLVLELKRDGTKLKNRKGEWKDEHTKRQAEWLNYFRNMLNAKAEFACGKLEAIKLIDEYLNPKDYGKKQKRRN